MTGDARIQQAAHFLWEGHKAGNRFEPIPDDFAPRTIVEAYDIQETYHRLIIPARGPIAGYKIALTTPVMQKMVGFDSPCAGAVFANDILHSPATVKASDYGRLGVECEIAVLLNRDLAAAAAPYDRARAAEAVEALMPAFELVDDRNADYSNLSFLSVAADNTWNAGVVLGGQAPGWRGIDLVAAAGSMTINGEPAGEGKGGDVLGHPLEALAWLANTLAERGKSLSAGMIVMTGSIVTTKFLNAGDTAAISIEGLGGAQVTVV
ncbi:MAG: fumarylacetoacetate hydrolase family protein [Chloroflexi bacterium]|nr:fumarylacetoacetate hydrolase family protein [Chloroflexota bacterium]